MVLPNLSIGLTLSTIQI